MKTGRGTREGMVPGRLTRWLGVLLAVLAAQELAARENIIVVVIDGARFQETIGARDRYIPRMWTLLSQEGSLFTNFRNDGVTTTCPGHTSILTGEWIDIPNDGSLGLGRHLRVFPCSSTGRPLWSSREEEAHDAHLGPTWLRRTLRRCGSRPG
jgi:hypothetical protein